MPKNNDLRDEIKSQNKKLKNMTFSQKKEYIWEYYKIHILGSFIAILCIIFTVAVVIQKNYNVVFNTVVIDGNMTGFNNNSDILTTEFTKYIGVDGKHNRVVFNNHFSLIKREGDQDYYLSIQHIATMATSKSIDGYLSEYDYINFYNNEDDGLLLTDLTELLTPDELSKLSNYLIYYTNEDGTKIPVAVDLSTTHIKTETDLTMRRPCYGIVFTSEHKDNAVKFIKYAFDL